MERASARSRALARLRATLALLSAVCLPAAASDTEAIANLLRTLSIALSDGSAVRFLAQVDGKNWPGYAALQQNVAALVAQNDVGSSVDLIETSSSGEGYDLRLDWLLQLRPAAGEGAAQTRRRELRCRVERRGSRWKVTRIEPVEFFRPPGGTQ